MGKAVSGLSLIFLISATLLFSAFHVQSVKAQVTVYIRPDGSIDPPTAPISTSDNVIYIFTGNVTYPTYNGITVQRSNIVIDGAGYTVRVTQNGTYGAISLTGTNNVTIKNTDIRDSYVGIFLAYSSNNNTISGNIITANTHGIDIYSSSNNNVICGNDVTANSGIGIGFDNSNNNSVIGNNATANGNEGIAFFSSNNNTVIGNNVTANSSGIVVSYSSNNTFIGNNVAASTWDGIDVDSSASHNTFFGNNITVNGRWGISFVGSPNNTVYHNNFIGNGIQAYNQASPGNAWNDAYPSGGNYWSTYSGTDLYTGAYQNETGIDGIGDTPYVIDSSNQDNYPLTKSYAGPHDIGITYAATSKTGCLPMPTVGQGYFVNVTAGVLNYGDQSETFNVTVHTDANTSTINQTQVTLTSRNFTTTTFTIDTTDLAYGNCTIRVYVWPVLNETDTMDNSFLSWIMITVPGDVNGDGTVNILDSITIGNSFLARLGDSNCSPNADINCDDVINILDSIIIGNHFLEHHP